MEPRRKIPPSLEDKANAGAQEVPADGTITELVSDLLHVPLRRKQEMLADVIEGKTVVIGGMAKKAPTEQMKLDRDQEIEYKCMAIQRNAKPNINNLEVTFGMAIEMNKLWDTYARSVLSECGNRQLQDVVRASRESYTELMKATPTLNNSLRFIANMDLHGSPMVVSKAADRSLVGFRGICVCETKNAFALASPSKKSATVVLKRGTTMCVLFPDPATTCGVDKGGLEGNKKKYKRMLVYIDCSVFDQTSPIRSTKSYKERRVWGV